VLHSGHVCGQENGLLTFEAMKYNRHELPKSFGGMSGGGLWRIYFVESENETKIVATMLCGIASWQIDDTRIACQGWDRIDPGPCPECPGEIPLLINGLPAQADGRESAWNAHSGDRRDHLNSLFMCFASLHSASMSLGSKSGRPFSAAVHRPAPGHGMRGS
jgi:hypothetical protein